MTIHDIIGSWHLRHFEITDPGGVTRPWGRDVSGLLIYTTQGTMSVSINRAIEGDPSDPSKVLAASLFYAGTYRLEGTTVIHHVTQATDPQRIGQDMYREASLEGHFLTLIGRGAFGQARLVWERS